MIANPLYFLPSLRYYILYFFVEKLKTKREAGLSCLSWVAVVSLFISMIQPPFCFK